MENTLLGDTTTALVKQASSGEIAGWTDEKKKDFTKTFSARARVARYILMKTGYLILDGALRRQFISGKHTDQLQAQRRCDLSDLYDEGCSRYGHNGKIGGRPTEDLISIADERANLVLKELPPLKKAVMVIDADTAAKIGRKDQIMAELKRLKATLEDPELSGPIKMDEVDPNMKVGDFMKMAKDRVKKRQRIFRRMGDLGSEGYELEETINKRLYKGLPGLSDAVVSVAKQHFDRAVALDEMDRRVGEHVMFGDSEAALEMLKGFEKDEQTIPESIKAEFRSALDKLKVSKKQLSAGKKKKKKSK